jgi:hypothetical protein
MRSPDGSFFVSWMMGSLLGQLEPIFGQDDAAVKVRRAGDA